MGQIKRNGKTQISLFGMALGSVLSCLLLIGAMLSTAQSGGKNQQDYLFNDSHFHLTNYIQRGTDIQDYVDMMGDTVGRSTLFGIPLQQQWDHSNTGDWAPTYYLDTDAPLYYYSFTDAHIANAYLSLSEEDRARLDPMITGFNPTDMYAVDHIRRVLETYPGVFTGIGEFTIHKEFVSSKIAGDTASLVNPALDRIFDFAGQVGLPVILHSDINNPFPKPEQEPFALAQLKKLFARHPDTTIIWAHIGLGRVVRPVKEQIAIMQYICKDPKLKHVYMDISWDEVAKYATETPQATRVVADALNTCPDRYLFGSDVVAPKSIDAQKAVYDLYAPLWKLLKPETREKVLKGNYERIFNEGRRKVRAWEKANIKQKSN